MTFGYMIYRFFHDKIEGDEWLIIQHLPLGNYKAICTRENEYYKLGDVKTFFFDDFGIWSKGKIKPNNHSLTNKKKYDGNPRITCKY
jgi:hypothetical protein